MACDSSWTVAKVLFCVYHVQLLSKEMRGETTVYGRGSLRLTLWGKETEGILKKNK